MRNCINKRTGLKEFFRLVKRHKEKIAMIKQFNEMFLLNIFACLLICVYGFLATSAHNWTNILKHVALLQALMFQLYQFCHMGQLLTDATGEIACKIYNTSWYENTDKHFRYGLRLMMPAQKSFPIKVGHFARLNLATFTKLNKT